jgi:hypothetical protein
MDKWTPYKIEYSSPARGAMEKVRGHKVIFFYLDMYMVF